MATADTIKQYFVNILQRDPTAAESAYWVATVDSSALTLTQARDAIAGSGEAVTYVDQIVRIYQAAFGRKPDVTGINGWADELRADATALSKIAAGFVNSTEWKNRYGDNTVNDAVLQALYVNVLGRVGSAEEIKAWKDTGQSMTQILIGFSNSAEFTEKARPSIMALKQAAGDVATSALDTVYTGSGALFDPAAGNGKTYQLTTFTDNINGTAGNDTINGVALAADGTTAATTLNPLDVINGGDGVDTLVLDTTGNQNQTIAGTITNVENLTFVGSGAAIAAVDASAFSGAIKFQQTADTSLSVNNVKGQTLTLDRVADTTTLTAAYDASQTSAGVVAAGVVGDATFSISGTGLKSASLTVDKTATGKSVTVTDTGNTTTGVTIAASGASTVVANSTALETVTVTGAGAVSLTLGTAASKSVNAAGSTGGLNLATAMATGATFTGGAGKDTATIGATTVASVMGAGDDKVNLSVAALGTGGSIDGGDGSDTISLSAADAVTASADTKLAAAISNFEKFGIGATGAASVVNADNIDGITHIVSAGTVGANTLTVNNLAANSTFEMTALAAAAVTLNLKNDTGTSDVVNLNFSNTDGFTSTAAIVVANVEALNITTDDTDTTAPTTVFTAPITAAAVKTVVVKGDVGIDLTGLTATTITSFDASGVTATGAAGAVTFVSGNLAADATVKGGAGNDVLNMSAVTGKAITVDGGAGNDVISTGAKADTITGGAGNDTINSGAGLDTIDVGAGDDTFVLTANANGNTYATLTGMGKGDKVDFIDGAAAGLFNSTKIALADTAAFADYLEAATASTAASTGANGLVTWFQWGGNTYLVEDRSTNATFTNGTDQVVKLVGLVDLSTAAIDGATTNVLTLG